MTLTDEEQDDLNEMTLIKSEHELNEKISNLEKLTPQGISEDVYIKGMIDNFNYMYLRNLKSKRVEKERFTRDSEEPKFLPQKDRYLPRNFKYANKQESTNKASDIMDIVHCKEFVNSVDESDVDEYDKKLLLFIFDKQLQQLNSINDNDDDKYADMLEASRHNIVGPKNDLQGGKKKKRRTLKKRKTKKNKKKKSRKTKSKK